MTRTTPVSLAASPPGGLRQHTDAGVDGATSPIAVADTVACEPLSGRPAPPDADADARARRRARRLPDVSVTPDATATPETGVDAPDDAQTPAWLAGPSACGSATCAAGQVCLLLHQRRPGAGGRNAPARSRLDRERLSCKRRAATPGAGVRDDDVQRRRPTRHVDVLRHAERLSDAVVLGARVVCSTAARQISVGGHHEAAGRHRRGGRPRGAEGYRRRRGRSLCVGRDLRVLRRPLDARYPDEFATREEDIVSVEANRRPTGRWSTAPVEALDRRRMEKPRPGHAGDVSMLSAWSRGCCCGRGTGCGETSRRARAGDDPGTPSAQTRDGLGSAVEALARRAR